MLKHNSIYNRKLKHINENDINFNDLNDVRKFVQSIITDEDLFVKNYKGNSDFKRYIWDSVCNVETLPEYLSHCQNDVGRIRAINNLFANNDSIQVEYLFNNCRNYVIIDYEIVPDDHVTDYMMYKSRAYRIYDDINVQDVKKYNIDMWLQ